MDFMHAHVLPCNAFESQYFLPRFTWLESGLYIQAACLYYKSICRVEAEQQLKQTYLTVNPMATATACLHYKSICRV